MRYKVASLLSEFCLVMTMMPCASYAQRMRMTQDLQPEGGDLNRILCGRLSKPEPEREAAAFTENVGGGLKSLLGPGFSLAAVQEEQCQESGSTGASASQAGTVDQPKPQTATHTPAALPTLTDKKTDDSQLKQTPRIFGVMPNFTAVSPDTQLPPLSTRGKFVLAMHDSVDYSSFVLVGLLSAESLARNSDPELGRGIAGYGRYYWRSFTDQASGTFFMEAIVPTLTHEDPRYYTLGHGKVLQRTAYALSRVVITTMDSGGTGFNYSEIVGNAMEAGLSNLYYPPQERGLHKTVVNWGTQTAITGAANVLKEFWPDIRHSIRHYIFRQE